MVAGLTTKIVGDGNSGTFTAGFNSSDGTGAGTLRPAMTLYDSAGNEILFSIASAVFPSGRNYKDCAASATTTIAQGGAGATGDVIDQIWIIPGTTSPGAVTLKDGAGSAITIFTGGTSSVSNLVPFPVFVGSAASAAGAWSLITLTNVTARVIGKF